MLGLLLHISKYTLFWRALISKRQSLENLLNILAGNSLFEGVPSKPFILLKRYRIAVVFHLALIIIFRFLGRYIAFVNFRPNENFSITVCDIFKSTMKRFSYDQGVYKFPNSTFDYLITAFGIWERLANEITYFFYETMHAGLIPLTLFLSTQYFLMRLKSCKDQTQFTKGLCRNFGELKKISLCLSDIWSVTYLNFVLYMGFYFIFDIEERLSSNNGLNIAYILITTIIILLATIMTAEVFKQVTDISLK